MTENILFVQYRGKSLCSAFLLASSLEEFLIVIIKTGVDIGALNTMFPLIGVISIITRSLSPFLIRTSEKTLFVLKDNDYK